jgi:hypothetical protein
MALSEVEVNFLEDNSSVFESGDLDTICKRIAEGVKNREIMSRQAIKIAFFSALAIDKDRIKVIIQNRGDSRSKRRADIGQKVIRIYYGVKLKSGVAYTDDPAKEGGMVSVVVNRGLHRDVHTMFAFTYFKGTLKPESLGKLLLEPMKKYNTNVLGKPYTDILRNNLDQIDWSDI